MKKFSLTACILAFLTLCVYLVFAQKGQEGKSLEEAASDGLKTLAALITKENYKNFGLNSIDQAQSLRLGEATHLQMIGLDNLKAFKSETDPKSLIVPMNSAVYSVLDAKNGDMVTSIQLQDDGGKWTATSFGNANLAKIWQSGLAKAKADGKTGQAIWIPSLNIHLVGYEADGKSFLALADDRPIADLEPNVFLPANELLDRLKPVAYQYNGLPW